MASEQKLSSSTIDVYREWEDLRSEAVTFLSLLYLICGIFLIGHTLSLPKSGNLITNLIPWVILSLAGMITFTVKDKYPRLVIPIVIGIGWVVLVIQELLVSYQESLLYFTIFPVLVGLIFLHYSALPKLSIFAVILIVFIDSVTYNLLWIAGHTVTIGLLAISAGVCGYIMLYNAQLMVQWAVDSQGKNYIRAESFYEQGEQLRTSLNDLKHANEQLRRLTVELNEAKQAVEEISQAKSVFLSNMSHELRTPLNMVIGYTSSILKMPQMYNNQQLPAVFRKDVEVIQASGQYLLALINDILDLSKIESGKFQINPTAFDLAQVLQGVIATSLGLIKDKPLQLKPDYPDNLPLVWGDPIRVRQILLNLLSNAIKYTNTGSVVLSAQLRDNQIALAVIDTGIGIPENVIATIFDRFEQVQNNANIQGTGLGLDISQRLAQMHGSEITIESTLGIGSTFAFNLALATPEQSASYNHTHAGHELTGIKRFNTRVEDWHERYTVVIAEDDSVTRGLLIRIFEAQNYIVFDVQNGNDVFEMVSAILPDIVILDIMLPNKDGWAILDELKATPETSEIPVIVLTANLDTRHKRKADIYLEKPVNVQEIIDLSAKLVMEKSPSRTEM